MPGRYIIYVCVCYIYIECSPRNAREIHHILGMAGRRNVFAHISRNPLWSWVFKPSQENLRFWFCNILCVCMIMYAYILFSHLVLQLAMCRWRQRSPKEGEQGRSLGTKYHVVCFRMLESLDLRRWVTCSLDTITLSRESGKDEENANLEIVNEWMLLFGVVWLRKQAVRLTCKFRPVSFFEVPNVGLNLSCQVHHCT